MLDAIIVNILSLVGLGILWLIFSVGFGGGSGSGSFGGSAADHWQHDDDDDWHIDPTHPWYRNK